MGNQQPLKLFLVLLLSTLYIFSFSHLGAFAHDAFTDKKDYFDEGTIIGNLPVAGRTEDEANSLIKEELSKWFTNTSITVQYMDKSKTLDLSSIEFDVETSVSTAQQGKKNLVQATIESLNDFLKSLSTTINFDDFNVSSLQNEILRSAMTLEPGNYNFRVEDFRISTSVGEDTVIEETPIVLEQQKDNFESFVGMNIQVDPKSQFSFLRFLEEENLQTLPAGTLNRVASAIYRVILPTNFSILERHISSSLPAYAVLGFEAKVDVKNNFDLAFSNPNDSEYTIEFANKDQSLIVSLKGPEFLNEYSISLQDEKTFDPKTVKQFSPHLNSDAVTVKDSGQEGLYIKVFREHHDENGALLQKNLISEDFYAPVHRVELHALNEEGKTEEDPVKESGENGNNQSGNDENDDANKDKPGTEEDDKEEQSDGNDDAENGEDESAEEDSDSDLWGDPNEKPKR